MLIVTYTIILNDDRMEKHHPTIFIICHMLYHLGWCFSPSISALGIAATKDPLVIDVVFMIGCDCICTAQDRPKGCRCGFVEENQCYADVKAILECEIQLVQERSRPCIEVLESSCSRHNDK